jgi:hypothetical protein
MAFEDVCSIEALLRRRARSRAKSANHVALVVGQRVAVLIILASESLVVVGAVDYWALLWSLGQMGEHVGLEILEWSSTVWMRTTRPLLAIVIESIVGGSWTLHGIARMA